MFPGDNDPLIDGYVLKLGDYSEVHNNDSILSKNGYAEMARDFMAQMLDELMGRNRNARPDERQDLRWDDPTVRRTFCSPVAKVVWLSFGCGIVRIQRVHFLLV